MTTEAAEEAGFQAGFSKVSPSLSLASADAPAVPSAAPSSPAAPAAAEPAAPAKDEWEGVQPKVRETLESISGRLGDIGKLDQRLKTTEGRVAALQSAVSTAKAVTKEGGQAPSQQQIQDASGSLKEWTSLLESFPDFKAGLEEKFNAIDARLQQNQPFDVDGLKSEVSTLVSNSTRELREFAKLDSKHDGWEDTINTPQFAEWAFSQGPTAVEQAQWRVLKGTSPDQAEQFFQAFEQRYPQWWKERGSHMASSSAKDAIALLDGYQAHTTAVSEKQKRDEKNAQRLEGAVMPRSAGAPPGQPMQDEEASFNAGFKRVAKK